LDTEAIGPTITGMIDLRNGNPQTDLVIEDLRCRARFVACSKRRRLRSRSSIKLANPDFKSQMKGDGQRRMMQRRSARDQDALLVLAMIGRDDAEGELALGTARMRRCRRAADSALAGASNGSALQQHHERLAKLMQHSKLGRNIVNNLMWRPFSDTWERLFEAQRGPLVTVHPLRRLRHGRQTSAKA